jgi:deoxyribodipyrimidine photolyase-related protein
MSETGKSLYFVGPWDLHADLRCVPKRPEDGTVVMVESVAKRRALPYHGQKLVLVLSAMHHFAAELSERGYDVRLVNAPTYVQGLERVVGETKPSRVVAMKPREWGLHRALTDAATKHTLGVPFELHDDGGPGGHFLLSRAEFEAWAAERKQLRMADFYAWMRKRTGYLMNGTHPEGRKWSFDTENRKKPRGIEPPAPPFPELDEITATQIRRVKRWGNFWGELEPFRWSVTRAAALAGLDAFFAQRSDGFGPFQDAMLQNRPFMWHTLIAPAMNLSLLSPREVCERIVREYERGKLGLASAEGLLRQILGWREFMRGVYWRQMPGLRTANHLAAERALPDFYWDSSQTKMACLRACVSQIEQTGYAHHIQRLMILGNYALLAGISPRQLSHWFWATFVDAYEWVELPNVVGMATFGDPSFTTKPYAASGNYIQRMSNYCQGCAYQVKRRHGEDACPFNALYWSFMIKHRELLSENPRMRQSFRVWDALPIGERTQVLASAARHLESLVPASPDWKFDDDAC